MAQTATDVLSLARAKRELAIDASVKDDDSLLLEQIAVAVGWVSDYLDAPLIQERQLWPAVDPCRDDDPIYLEERYVEQILGVRYWADGTALREESDGTVSATDLGRAVKRGPTLWQIWPPADGWPARESRSEILVAAVRQMHPLPAAVVSGCIIALRQLYDGIQDIRPTSMLRAILSPYHLYAPRLARGRHRYFRR